MWQQEAGAVVGSRLCKARLEGPPLRVEKVLEVGGTEATQIRVSSLTQQ